MKKTGFALLLSLLLMALALPVFAEDDIKKHSSCKYCGMDREKFAHSRMLIEYADGTQVGTCSIHCTGIDLALNIDKFPKFLGVGDFMQKPSSIAKRPSGSWAATSQG